MFLLLFLFFLLLGQTMSFPLNACYPQGVLSNRRNVLSRDYEYLMLSDSFFSCSSPLPPLQSFMQPKALWSVSSALRADCWQVFLQGVGCGLHGNWSLFFKSSFPPQNSQFTGKVPKAFLQLIVAQQPDSGVC